MVLKSWCDNIIQSTYLNSDIDDLVFITHFNASSCHLYSQHLEELAMACPNLLELNLEDNAHCLQSLQGLRVIASGCKKLQGLNLLFVSVKDVENCVQLWETLVEMKLIYLGIEFCVLLPYEVDKQVTEMVVSLHRKY